MTPTSFGSVSDLPPYIDADYVVDFTDGNFPIGLMGPAPSSAGPRTYCDMDRMYLAAAGQPRIGYDHDNQRWGLRRDLNSSNLVECSQYETDRWNGSDNGKLRSSHNAAEFLLPSERCSVMDYRAEPSTYIYCGPSASSRSYTEGTRYTASMFFRTVDGENAVRVRLMFHSDRFGAYQGVIYRPSDDTAQPYSSNSADTSVSMQKYPKGWRRLIVTATAASSGGGRPPMLWPDDSTQGKFLYGGFQLESIAYVTSYMPKASGASVSRAESGFYITVPDEIVASLSSASMWADCQMDTIGGNSGGVATLGNAGGVSGRNMMGIYATTNSTNVTAKAFRFAWITDGQSSSQAAPQQLSPHRSRDVVAAAWDSSTQLLNTCHLGGYPLSDPVAVSPAFPGVGADVGRLDPRMTLGSYQTLTGSTMTGWIYGVRIYRRRLTPDQLKEAAGLK